MSTELLVEPFVTGLEPEWDDFARAHPRSTFQHTRRFLAYHGERFDDCSLLVREQSGHLVGVFSAARDPARPRCLSSHPGATFGGLLSDPRRPGQTLTILEAIAEHARERGFERLRYKLVPAIYHAEPASDDLYALFRLGAQRIRCDLAATIDLSTVRLIKKARRHDIRSGFTNVEVEDGSRFLSELWPIVAENLLTRHGAIPTHSLAEIQRLLQLFEDEITCRVALYEGRVVAGIVMFRSSTVHHVQYMGSSERGRAIHALDAIIEWEIAAAEESGARFFDFGISTVDEGRVLNDGLHRYKTSFGAGSTTYEHYEFILNTPRP